MLRFIMVRELLLSMEMSLTRFLVLRMFVPFPVKDVLVWRNVERLGMPVLPFVTGVLLVIGLMRIVNAFFVF
jgi:hypothetical protein